MSTVLNEGGSPLRKPRQGVGPVIGREPSRGTSAWSGSPRMRDGVDCKTVPANDNRELSSRNFIRVDRGASPGVPACADALDTMGTGCICLSKHLWSEGFF